MNKEIMTEAVKHRTILENWTKNPVGNALLAGIEDSKMKTDLAVLLENQRRELINEASGLGDIKGWQNVALPLVRRFFPSQIAHKIVGVQPLTLPSGLVFYLDFKYNTSRGTFNSAESVYGNPLGAELSEYGAYGTGGLYELQNAYSKYIALQTGTVGAVGDITEKDVDFDSRIVLDINKYKYVDVKLNTVGNAGTDRVKIGDFDLSPNGVRQIKCTYSVTQNNQTFTYTALSVYNKYYISGNDKILRFIFHKSSGITTDKTVTLEMPCVASTTYSNGVNLTDPWQSTFNPPGAPEPIIPEIDLSITSKTIVSEPRKLRAKWTPEVAQDLSAYHNVDGEVLVTKILAEYISYEIDREIIGDLLFCRSVDTGSAYTRHAADYYWSRSVGKYVKPESGEEVPGSWFGTRSEWYQTLMETINAVSNIIFKKTLRGRANWIIVSTEVATILESTALLRSDVEVVTPEVRRVGVERIGTLAGKYDVFVDPYFIPNKILIGYGGKDFFDTGYIYAPYIPLIMTPTIFGVEDFTPRKGIMTRYGRMFIRPDFYGTVTVMDL